MKTCFYAQVACQSLFAITLAASRGAAKPTGCKPPSCSTYWLQAARKRGVLRGPSQVRARNSPACSSRHKSQANASQMLVARLPRGIIPRHHHNFRHHPSHKTRKAWVHHAAIDSYLNKRETSWGSQRVSIPSIHACVWFCLSVLSLFLQLHSLPYKQRHVIDMR